MRIVSHVSGFRGSVLLLRFLCELGMLAALVTLGVLGIVTSVLNAATEPREAGVGGGG